MKNLPKNSKNLESLINRLSEDMHRIIKFTKNLLSQGQLICICINHLNSYLRDDSDKQNTNSNIPHNVAVTDHSRQVQQLRKQLMIQHDLSRKMFIQMNRDKLKIPELAINSRSADIDPMFLSAPLVSSFQSSYKMVDNVPLISSVTEQSDLNKGEYGMISSKCSTAVTNRTNRHIISNIKTIEEQSIYRNSKRKTFSKLRKLETMFCTDTPKNNLRRKNQTWFNNSEINHEVLFQQNENLKAIQSNLITHLILLEKFKHVESLQSLVQKENMLIKKEDQLKGLQQYLLKKQLELNKSFSQLLRKPGHFS